MPQFVRQNPQKFDQSAAGFICAPGNPGSAELGRPMRGLKQRSIARLGAGCHSSMRASIASDV